MATSRPFAYNTGSTLPYTEQVGDIAIGVGNIKYSEDYGGLKWWMGPDEDLGYVIAHTVPAGNQPTQVPEDAITLSSTYKGIDIALSNNDQTAAQIFSYQQSVLGETIISGTNKVMFSIQYTSTNPSVGIGGHFIGVGLTNMNYSGPFNGYPGNDANSIGFSDDGNYYFNGSLEQTGLPTWTDGDIIDIAIAHGQYWWIRVNGGDWNNNPSANPTTLTGGTSMDGLTNFYPALCPYIYGTMQVLNYPKYGVPSQYNFLGNVTASIGFWRSSLKTEQSYVNLVNGVFNQTFTTGDQCNTYLNNNGYWTSYVVIPPNLKLYLDASNPNSYSGAGTTWYDLSGNGNDVEMVNSGSITWNTTGAIYFSTGSNGWFSNPSGTDLPVGNSPYTFIAWVQLGTTWNSNGIMSIGPFGSGNQANAFRAGSTNQLINYWWANDLAVNTSVSPTNGWFNAVAKYDGTTRSIWVNGVLAGSDNTTGHNVTTNALQIAKTTGSEYLNGNVGEVLIYDTALSNSDILQYFNDTKTRYGL